MSRPSKADLVQPALSPGEGAGRLGGQARVWGAIAAVNGALAVVTGAFGAHGLRSRVGPDLLAIWETAAHYHLIHALALLGAAGVLALRPSALARAACWALLGGFLIFSGSLYLLVLSDVRRWGMVTPLGGLLLIGGWLLLAAALMSRRGTSLN